MFLLDYVVEVIDKIYGEVDWNETDLFERMRQLGVVKFKIYKKYPQAFDFINAASYEEASDVKPEINKIGRELIAIGLEKSFKNIDLTKFRNDMDLEKMMNIITLTILGLAEQQRKKVKSFDDVDIEALEVFDEYFSILKRCFYREEEQ